MLAKAYFGNLGMKFRGEIDWLPIDYALLAMFVIMMMLFLFVIITYAVECRRNRRNERMQVMHVDFYTLCLMLVAKIMSAKLNLILKFQAALSRRLDELHELQGALLGDHNRAMQQMFTSIVRDHFSRARLTIDNANRGTR